MEGSPLDTAYSLVRKAEQATQNGDYTKASTLHLEAAAKFSDAQELTHSTEAKWMLHALSQKNLARSLFLSKLKPNDRALIQQQQQQQHLHNRQQLVQHDELTSSLASARGIVSSPGSSVSVPATATTATAGTNASAKKKLSEEDPFYKFYSSINNVFAKSFNASIEKAKEDQLQQLQQQSLIQKNSLSNNELNTTITNLMIPMKFDNESFYVVPNTSKLSQEELTTENTNLRQMINRSTIQLHAYETATKKQKDALKNNLMLLRNEFNTRETNRTRQHEADVEALNGEIDKLKIQIGRMKSRWEDLKANARKRREESVTDDDDDR